MPSIKATSIKKGSYILFKDDPHYVTKTEFSFPGKGSAFMKCRLKNIYTQNTVEFTFKSTETVEEVEVNSKQMQFLYQDGDDLVFMDPRTYDQVELPLTLVEDKVGFLTTDLENVYVLFYDEKPVGINLPPKVTLEVTYAEDATAGNRVNAPKKPVTVETGITVHAPLFINKGDKIVIDTTTGDYVSRG